MSGVIAKMLLDRMDEAGANTLLYNGQEISRRYLRNVLWKSYNYSESRKSLIRSQRVLPINNQFSTIRG